MSNDFLDRLSKSLIETSKKASNPKLIAEARTWYKNFMGASATPMSDEEVVEIYNILKEEVDN
jgi:hypothetical protein